MRVSGCKWVVLVFFIFFERSRWEPNVYFLKNLMARVRAEFGSAATPKYNFIFKKIMIFNSMCAALPDSLFRYKYIFFLIQKNNILFLQSLYLSSFLVSLGSVWIGGVWMKEKKITLFRKFWSLDWGKYVEEENSFLTSGPYMKIYC